MDLDKAERKRSRKRSRKCKPVPSTPGKKVNDLTVYIVAAIAIGCSLFISSLCYSQQQQQQAVSPTNTVAVLPAVQSIPVSGEWQMEVAADQTTTTFGVVSIKQDNSVIYGKGQDPAGAFALDGKLWSNRIWFIKRYDEEACERGAHRQDIVFDGIVSNQGNNLLLEGKYETQMKAGYPTSYFKKTEWQTVSGRWCAHKIGELSGQVSLQMDRQRAAWNPFKDLATQPPTTNLQQPIIPAETEAQRQSQMVANAFYLILALAVVAIFGWLVFIVYRYLRWWSESPSPKKCPRSKTEELQVYSLSANELSKE